MNSIIPSDYNVNVTIDIASALMLGMVALGVIYLGKHL